MKKYFLVTAAAFMLTGYGVTAQDKTEKEKTEKQENDNKLKEYDEIIIKRKEGDKDTKVTIEIRDDEVFVDGKPLDEYTGDELSVRKRGHKRYRLDAPSPFRFEGGDWRLENDMLNPGEDVAFLGIMTKGSSNGAKVEKVTENSAADKAGLKEGDVITKIDDKSIFDHEQLSEAISARKPGDKVTITYNRDGKERKSDATLGSRKSRPMADFRNMPNMPPQPPMMFDFDDKNFERLFDMRGDRPRLGIKVQDTEEGKGVKVLEVEKGSAAEKSGIKENDVIISFEGKNVESASALAQASREARDKSSVKVQLKRNGKPQTIEVKVPKKLKTANL